MNPLVSILIPIYGVEKYIEKCAISVFEQTYKNIEVIFVNDCTKDSSINILIKLINNEYSYLNSKIQIINHKENKGISGARNTAFDNAIGDFIFYLDSDDYLNKDAIEILVNKAIKTTADIVFSDANIIYTDKFVRRKNNFIKNKEDYLKKVILRENNFNVWGNLYLRSLYKDVRFFEGSNFGEDYVILPRIIYYAKKIVYLDKVTYNYLQENTASYTNNLSVKSINDIFIGYDKMYDFFKIKNNIDYLKYAEDAFYVLKSHMIKSSKGDKNILRFIKSISSSKPDKYPKENSSINNVLNFLLDLNYIGVLSVILKVFK